MENVGTQRSKLQNTALVSAIMTIVIQLAGFTSLADVKAFWFCVVGMAFITMALYTVIAIRKKKELWIPAMWLLNAGLSSAHLFINSVK